MPVMMANLRAASTAMFSNVISQPLHEECPSIAHCYQLTLDRVCGFKVSGYESFDLLLVF
jgi:hypothetical protein